MKTRIVLWGENAQDDKILIAVELLEKENHVKVTTFPELIATEEFYTKMMNIWREGHDLPFPEDHTEIIRELSITEGLLPDDIKTMRSDILNRAKTEWHFVVLSAKLYESYNDELEEIKERIEKLTGFDGGVWEEMKGFWNKVQKQSAEKNLFRKHANDLRTKTNGLFEQMKGLKKALNEEFERASKETVETFYKKLDDIESRIEKGLGLHPIFNELKNLQQSFKDVELTRRDRNHLWKRTDKAFKKVKEKKYGKTSGGGGRNSALSRVSSRYDGLLNAIHKMQQSINRDKKDQEFQQKRIETTDGQLELQIRQAKMAMIIERLKSKEVKLQDMLNTKTELEQKMEAEKKREEKRKEKKETAKVKEQLKEEIATEIKVAAEARKEDEEKLVKAAESLKKTKKPEVAAAAAVIAVGAKEIVEEAKSTAEETVTTTTQEVVETAAEKVVETTTEDVVNTTTEKIVESTTTEMIESTEEVVQTAAVDEVVERATETVVETTAKEAVESTTTEVVGTTAEGAVETAAVEEVVETTTKDVVESATEKIVESNTTEVVETTAKEAVESTTEEVVQTAAVEVVETAPVEETPKVEASTEEE